MHMINNSVRRCPYLLGVSYMATDDLFVRTSGKRKIKGVREKLGSPIIVSPFSTSYHQTLSV